MTTTYEYGMTASEVPVLETQPLDLSADDLDAIRGMLATSEIAVRAAHVYDRKGYATTDDFAGPPNPSYRGMHDDIVVQVSMVVHYWSDADEIGRYHRLSAIHDNVQADKQEAEIAAQQAEVAQAEADLAAAQARLDALRRTT